MRETEASAACLVCGGCEFRTVFVEHGVDVVRCRACRHVQSTWRSEADFAGYFDVQDLGSEITRYWWGEAHQAPYDDFARRFLTGRSGRLLDVGAGLGFFVKYVSEEHPAWEVHGSEISERAVAYARGELGLGRMLAGRVQDAPFEPASFDLITLWDVIEHLAEPDAMLGHLAGLLRPDGRLFLHTPNVQTQLPKARVKRWLHGMQPGRAYLEAKDHLHDYSPRSLRKVLARSGFGRVRFLHLRPIQSVAGSRSRWLRAAKNGWALVAGMLHRASLGTVNLDNLFVIASKGGPGA